MVEFLWGALVGAIVAIPTGMYLLRQHLRRIARLEGSAAVLYALGIEDSDGPMAGGRQ